MIRGLRNMYTIRAHVFHVLPGATRKNPYEGHYLHRGTLRELPGEAPVKRSWWGKKKNAKQEGVSTPVKAGNGYVETSGWYSDSD